MKLQPKFLQPRMILGPWPERPVEQSPLFENRNVVNARHPARHQAIEREYPILNAVVAMPRAGIVMPLIGEAHGNSIAVMRPQALDKPILVLATPLCG